jgi:hypothetical protein
MAPRQGKILTIAVATASATILGVWLFFESFLAPAGCCGATAPFPNPMQVGRLAYHQDPDDTNGALQRATALTILKARPGDVETWLRLAYADRLIHNRLTAEGDNALDVSYSLTPYAGPRAVWRVMFVLDNWTGAPERVRRDALDEIKIIKTDPNIKWELLQRTPSITDVNGRLAAVLFGVLPIRGLNIQ